MKKIVIFFLKMKKNIVDIQRILLQEGHYIVGMSIQNNNLKKIIFGGGNDMINRKQVVYKTELYKLYKRKDTWIFLTVILVPILYSVGIASGSEIVSYSGNGNITAINFISAMFQMAQSMFIFNIILVAITSRTLGTEIEDKSLRIYLNKVGDRKKSI